MTTAHSIQLKVQRSRFAQHALSALTFRLARGFGARPATTVGTGGSSRSERAALEAQEVREMAHACSRTDPGFASDLYAAAERHEGLFAD